MPRIYWLSKAFMRHPNVEIMLSSMTWKLTGYCKCQVKKNKCCAGRSAFGLRASVAREKERSGAKRRGRGLGQRNSDKCFLLLFTTFNG